ncbi:MAG: DUF1156 domain-containing protein [Phycisphaerae bacterium]
MAIERDFDVAFISQLALREKQIQQNYRPLIAVHKWFARRPGTLFRGLLLAEFSDKPLKEAFYETNQFPGLRIADPFMGGGTPLLEANRLGIDVVGCDINPMAHWIVRQEIEHLDLNAYRATAGALLSALDKEVGALYRTTCVYCRHDAPVKYFLWVKTATCRACGKDIDLFPGYVLSEDVRHPNFVHVCPACGALNDRRRGQDLGQCDSCRAPLAGGPAAKGGRCACRSCGHENRYPDPGAGPPKHRLFALEYHCPRCKLRHEGRFFKVPGAEDLAAVAQAQARLDGLRARFIPDDEIPQGDETTRLHRWGYSRYGQMFNARQLVGLELACRWIAQVPDVRVRNALATNLSDLLRYQNMLCRYDETVLKSVDIFSVHGFPVSLIQAESNMLGTSAEAGTPIGSGGWANIIAKFVKAKSYCDHPFEVRQESGRKVTVPIEGEWIGDDPNGRTGVAPRKVELHCGDSASLDIEPNSLDGVFTDPPYFGNVQYAELMDFCYVWLKRLVGGGEPAFAAASTRDKRELTGNDTLGRGLEDFAEGLSRVFRRMAVALKPGRPLVFTYHHNDLEAYAPIAVAVLDAGLDCTAAMPCPAEMSASIHINGTKSSIIDSVFVCRKTSPAAVSELGSAPETLAAAVRRDLDALAEGGREATDGDTLCIINGHLTRQAIGALCLEWDAEVPISDRLAMVKRAFHRLPAPGEIKVMLEDAPRSRLKRKALALFGNT